MINGGNGWSVVNVVNGGSVYDVYAFMTFIASLSPIVFYHHQNH